MWSFFTENNQMRHIFYKDNTPNQTKATKKKKKETFDAALQWARLGEVKKRWNTISNPNQNQNQIKIIMNE